MIGFLRLQPAAVQVGASIKTLRRAIAANELPAYRLGRKLLVVAERDLEAWIVARRVVELSPSLDPEVRDFIGDLLQPKCKRATQPGGKRRNGAAKSAPGLLIHSQLPAGNAPSGGR